MEHQNPESNQKFEEQMTQIDEIIRQLESGDLPLETMVSLYEKGMSLSKSCLAQLDAYDARIEILRNQQGTSEEK